MGLSLLTKGTTMAQMVKKHPTKKQTRQEASLADFANVKPNPSYTQEDALEFIRKVRNGELQRC